MAVYKVLMGGDLHKKHKDVSTIAGYVDACDVVELNLIRYIQANGITHFISLGDWYDRGYVDDIAAALADITYEEELKKSVNGNFYGVIGNHIQLNLDSNPELNLIQPHPVLKTRKPVVRTEPIMKTPDSFMVGTVQISLVHHVHVVSNILEYEIKRNKETTYHIAVLHDPKFLPNDKMREAGIPFARNINTYIDQVLQGVDMCVLGDIHKPLGLFYSSGGVPMYIPGSLTNTNVSLDSRHSEVKLPLFVIDTDTTPNTVSMEYVNFELPINMVTFSKKENEILKGDKLKSLRGKSKDKLYDEISDTELGSTEFLEENSMSMSFSDFLRAEKYTDADKELIKMVLRDPENLPKLVRCRMEARQEISEI